MDSTDSTKTVSQGARSFFQGTLISRISGMVRDMTMTFFFGAGAYVAAFLIAFRLSNILRRLFGEGALLNGFIPFFEERRKISLKDALLFFRDCFWSLFFFLSVLVFSLEVICYIQLSLGGYSESTKTIISLMMIMLPGLLFICLYALNSALLECEKDYFIPSIAPTTFNLIWIAAIWYSKNLETFVAMSIISYSIVVAFLCQWLFTLPRSLQLVKKELSWKEWIKPQFFSQEIIMMLSPLMLGVIGIAAQQINSALGVVLARFVSLEGPAYLSFAHRLQQFPLALFGISISSALMPPLARAVKMNQMTKYKELIQFGLLKCFSILILGSVAIFILGGASVNLLYGRGLFDQIATLQTTYCLFAYGLSLVPSAFVFIFATACYAKSDFWTPTKGALYSIIVNLIASFVFIFVLKKGIESIAVSGSVAAFYNMHYLSTKLKFNYGKKLSKIFAKAHLAVILSGVVVFFLGTKLFHFPSLLILLGGDYSEFIRSTKGQIIEFSALFALMSVVVFFFSWIFRVKEILNLFNVRKFFQR